MNREIKFRAWNKKSKEMIKPTGYYGSNLHWVIQGSNNGFWGIFDGNKRLCGNADESGILLQYTGLKDKNNKEIYEGDIVKYTENTYGDDYLQEFIDVVEFENGCFCIKNGYMYCYDLAYHNKEVIGNIYENKESLKEIN